MLYSSSFSFLKFISPPLFPKSILLNLLIEPYRILNIYFLLYIHKVESFLNLQSPAKFVSLVLFWFFRNPLRVLRLCACLWVLQHRKRWPHADKGRVGEISKTTDSILGGGKEKRVQKNKQKEKTEKISVLLRQENCF